MPPKLHFPRAPLALLLTSVLFWTGCVTTKPVPRPVPPPPPPVQPDLRSHLLGAWELPLRGGKTAQAVFQPDGRLVFQGALEYFNPARWRLEKARQELVLSFPQASNDKLDIFHMYLHQGVKAFDRPAKEVIYDFSPQTDELNLAGWTYTKPDFLPSKTEPEPVLK